MDYYGYQPSSSIFGGGASPYNYKPDSTIFGGTDNSSFSTPNFSDYWNPKGDTAGVPWDQATAWNPGKDFLSNWMSGPSKSSSVGRYQQEGEQSGYQQKPWFGGGGSSGTSGNLLPGFSAFQPDSEKPSGFVPSYPGSPGVGQQILGAALPVVSSFLGPIGAAAGGAIAKSLFPSK